MKQLATSHPKPESSLSFHVAKPFDFTSAHFLSSLLSYGDLLVPDLTRLPKLGP